MYNSTTIHTVYSAVTIVASGTSLSDPLDCSLSSGIFSLQLAITGDGTLKVEAKVSNDGTTYLVPDGASEIKTGLTKTSGPGGDGKIFIGFQTLGVSRFVKILLTETGGANSVTVTGTLAVQ
jgi:hypothetical protein